MKSTAQSFRIAAFAAFGLARAALATDGTCSPCAYSDNDRRWSNASFWHDGVVAGDGGVATLRNDWQTQSYCGKITNDVEDLTLSGISIVNTVELYGWPITMTGDSFIELTSGAKFTLGAILDGGGTATLSKRGAGTIKFTDPTRLQNFKSVNLGSSGVECEGPQNGGPAITDGDIVSAAMYLIYAPSPVTGGASRLAGDGKFTFSGETALDLYRLSSNIALTLPNALERTNQGVLAVYPRDGVAQLGASTTLNAPSVENDSIGMAPPWIYAHDYKTTTIHFLSNSADKGLLPMPDSTKTADLAEASNKIWKASANTTISDDASAHAVELTKGAKISIADGKKLTVGDGAAPAGVIIDMNGAISDPDYVYRAFTGGTLDFGAREAIFLSPEDGHNDMVTIASSIAGSNVTFATGAIGSGRRWQLSGNNTFNGTLSVLGTRVQVNHQAAAANCDIRVAGNSDASLGGQVSFLEGTYTNRIYASGFARDNGMRPCALFCYNVTLDGPITLEDDVGMVAASYSYTLALNNEIDGPGGLVAVGPKSYGWAGNTGTIALNHANTYLGKTIVEGGTVKLGANGTFGAGEVSGEGTLKIELAGEPKTVPNDFAMSGTTEILGNGSLEFTGTKADFASFAAGNASIKAGGAYLGLGSFSASAFPASVSAYGEGTHEVAMGGAADSSPDVVLADGTGALAFTKTGSGKLTLTREQQYTGATTVKEGTLSFGETVPSDNGVLYRLDASKTDTLFFGADNSVTGWVDGVNGRFFGVKYAKHSAPIYDPDAFGGRGAVRFPDNDLTNRLSMLVGGNLAHRTVFVVCQPDKCVNLDGVWGAGGTSAGGTDYGIRMGNASMWQVANPSFFFARTADDMRINGVTGNTFTMGEPQIMFARHVADANGNYSSTTTYTPSIGSYFYNDGNAPRAFRGTIAEVIAYDRLLSDDEIKLVENLLSKKWLGKTIHDDFATHGALPAASALALSEGATLDLRGVSQTVASLSGVGAIVNSSATPATLTVTGANSFAGTIGANVKLVANGGGSMKLAAESGSAATLGGALSLAAYDPFPVADGRVLWVDASRPDTMVTNELGRVVRWLDAGGANVWLAPCYNTNSFGLAAQPLWAYDETTGRGKVAFTPATTNFLYASAYASVRTLFIVNRPFSEGYLANGGLWGYAGGSDEGLRRGSATTWQLNGLGSFFHGSEMRINGVTTYTFEQDEQQILAVRKPHVSASGRQSLGGYYFSGNVMRPFSGEVMEMVAYDRMLSDDEMAAVETYLSAKWNGETISHRTQPIADGASLSFAKDAEVDLAGGSLALGGTLVVQVDAAGGSTPLVVKNGSVALDGTALSVVGELSRRHSYPIVLCPQIFGEFAGNNLPDKWELGARANGIYAKPLLGTVIIVR